MQVWNIMDVVPRKRPYPTFLTTTRLSTGLGLQSSGLILCDG